MNIDWRSIHALNGSSADGFEEFCVQLARAECPGARRFIRKGTPDAGVECYAALDGGAEWAWQAKYFFQLLDSQWSQIDHSVKTALDKHPKLTRYHVCVPYDRPDARNDNQRSAMAKWEAHACKWSEWAAERGMSVDFVYWGSSELMDRVARQNSGWTKFWFDACVLDDEWFCHRQDEALAAAGPRYSPEINVDLPVAMEFEAFGRTPTFFDMIKSHAREVRTMYRRTRPVSGELAAPELEDPYGELGRRIQESLTEFSEIEARPTGALPFDRMVGNISYADHAAHVIEELLVKLARKHEKERCDAERETSHLRQGRNPFQDCHYHVVALRSALRQASEKLVAAQYAASSDLMILTGDAGTGKTHLLCDIASKRLAKSQPTVLLMGQRFMGADDPWTQSLSQLDLRGFAAEEFVGALEAAAQVADCRVLVMIDALNEGEGRKIWPNHLAAFLTRLEGSPWIGVVLSVRSSYEDEIIPQGVRASAFCQEHVGFSDHEYDAMRVYFNYYDIELPSSPLLQPIYRNPLFLKTLCAGLKGAGEHRLPRGSLGITKVFGLYLETINNHLGAALDYNRKMHLVRSALQRLARMMSDSENRWVPLEEAEPAVNGFLPGREHSKSLYHALVANDLLREDMLALGDHQKVVVYIAYDRLADHLIAESLVPECFDVSDMEVALGESGSLGFLADGHRWVSPGLLEALFIRVPERTGRELISLAPQIANHWASGDAFRSSLVWRTTTAVCEETLDVLNLLIQTDEDYHQTLDTLLTVSTIPQHPLNAQFLDKRLRKDQMPDRDAWWSIYLHHAWADEASAVVRLIDWAYDLSRGAAPDDEVVDLCADVLAWMLTTSNRYVRDRATKALVNLLAGKLQAVKHLVERFADVDDPYVLERVYAVAYGVSMRCRDLEALKDLAECVYGLVFAGDAPPPHILLRDYARGVIEYGESLGARADVDMERIRPPYKSQWPMIPSAEDIKPLLPDWSHGSFDSGEVEWARNTIGFSVMSGDFAHYVIGSDYRSVDWLSLELDEPLWKSREERIETLVAGLPCEAKEAWGALCDAERELNRISPLTIIYEMAGDGEPEPNDDKGHGLDSETEELERTRENREAALEHFMATLEEGHRQTFDAILREIADNSTERPPVLESALIQRYVLWRVFDLGWTIERFGDFDRFWIGNRDRHGAGAERIGKKYQWIAYHEIMAHVADRYQFGSRQTSGPWDRVYDGPWQGHFRDIEPSCALQSTPGGTSFGGHAPAWWCDQVCSDWRMELPPDEWAASKISIPDVAALLCVRNRDDHSCWLNAQGYFVWQQPTPSDLDPHDVARRELMYLVNGYAIPTEDIDRFMQWAESMDLYGRWLPEPLSEYRMFLGEYGWSPAFAYVMQESGILDGWVHPERDCPARLRPLAFRYERETSDNDASFEDAYTLRLPNIWLKQGLGLHLGSEVADFEDDSGRVLAFDPTAREAGPSALLLALPEVREYLVASKLTVVWTVIGEKRVLTPMTCRENYPQMRMAGAFFLDSDDEPTGFLNANVVDNGTTMSIGRIR